MLSQEDIERGADFATRHIRNFHDREDAAQEYRIAAWQALGRSRPGVDPAPFQRAYGRGAVLNFFRAMRRQLKTVSLDTPLSQPHAGRACTLYDTFPSPLPDPAAVIADRDFLEQLVFLIKQLPPRQRRITEMWLQGMSTQEISANLGHTRQAVNRRKSEVIRTLRKKLGIRQVA